MDRAIALLPPELRPLFEQHRATVVERAIDPDTWRTAGFDEEEPNHFLDLDWEGYGQYPFNGAAARLHRGGRQVRPRPHRGDGNAAVAGRGVSRQPAPRVRGVRAPRRRSAQFDIVFYSAWLAHYVADAHVPFHAVVNYDGQLTGQNGIHAASSRRCSSATATS